MTERVEVLSALCEADLDWSVRRVVVLVLFWLWLAVELARFGVELRAGDGREAGRAELREDDVLLEEEELERRTGVDIVIQDTRSPRRSGELNLLPEFCRYCQVVAVLRRTVNKMLPSPGPVVKKWKPARAGESFSRKHGPEQNTD